MLPDTVLHGAIKKVINRPMVRFGSVAEATPFGSILQMHCWERKRGTPFFTQTKPLQYAPQVPMPYPDETIIGTKIALLPALKAMHLKTWGKLNG